MVYSDYLRGDKMYVEYGLLIFYILIMCYGMFWSMVALLQFQSVKGFMHYWWSLVNTSIIFIIIHVIFNEVAFETGEADSSKYMTNFLVLGLFFISVFCISYIRVSIYKLKG